MRIRLLLFFLFLTYISYSQTPPSDDVRRYLFDNADLLDTSTSSRNLTVRNGENNFTYTTAPDGGVLQAMELTFASFSGGAINSSLNATDWSFSFWIRTNVITPGNPEQEIMSILHNPNGQAVRGISIMQGANNISVNVRPASCSSNGTNCSTASPYFTFSAAIADNNWHHIVVGVSASDNASNNSRTFTTTIYIDNVLDTSNSNTYFGNNIINDGNLGYFLSRFSGNNFVGSLDNIRLFDRSLSGTEITELFNANSDVLSSDEFELSNNNLKLYPNPTTDILNIDSKNQQILNVKIYDITGKQVLNSNEKQINTSSLKSGVYLLKVITASRNIITRFIKQ